MQTMEYKTILDGNSYELNILGNMDMFKSVDINVYKADKKSGNYTYIGKYSDLDGDWDAGVFKDNFNGKMLRLCGKNISVNLVGKYDGYEQKKQCSHYARYRKRQLQNYRCLGRS